MYVNSYTHNVSVECEKSYERPSYLKRHNKFHTGGKFFTYNQCDKAYREPYNQRKYKKVHTYEELYKCYNCGKYKLTNHASVLGAVRHSQSVSVEVLL